MEPRPKYPHIRISLDEDTDALAIVGRLERSLRHAGVPLDEIDRVMEDALAGDYIHLLRTVMRTVEVEEQTAAVP